MKQTFTKTMNSVHIKQLKLREKSKLIVAKHILKLMIGYNVI